MVDYKSKPIASSFYRAIKNSYIETDGTIKDCAFHFRENEITGLKEVSINWNDDEGALEKLLKSKDKNGCLLCSKGYVLFNMAFINLKFFDYIKEDKLAFNRDPIYAKVYCINRYHGNLIATEKCSPNDRQFFRTNLALYANVFLIENE